MDVSHRRSQRDLGFILDTQSNVVILSPRSNGCVSLSPRFRYPGSLDSVSTSASFRQPNEGSDFPFSVSSLRAFFRVLEGVVLDWVACVSLSPRFRYPGSLDSVSSGGKEKQSKSLAAFLRLCDLPILDEIQVTNISVAGTAASDLLCPIHNLFQATHLTLQNAEWLISWPVIRPLTEGWLHKRWDICLDGIDRRGRGQAWSFHSTSQVVEPVVEEGGEWSDKFRVGPPPPPLQLPSLATKRQAKETGLEPFDSTLR